MAVVVNTIAVGPFTLYVCVTNRPEVVSFPVEAIDSSPSLCRSLSAYAALLAPSSSAIERTLCAKSLSPR
jgi:hypothetical protein